MSGNVIPVRGTLVEKTHSLTRDLVMCHAFNEGTGEFLFDASGNGHHGNGWFNGPAWDSGNSRLGSAVRMGDSSGCRIDMAGQGWVRSDQPFSVGLWVKLSEVGGNRQFMTSSVADFTCSIIVSGDDNMRFYVDAATRGTKIIVADVWYHYIATFDGSFMQIYTDGKADGDPDAASGKYGTSAVTRWGSSSSSNYLRGLIALGYAWNRCLRPAEIAMLYREPWAMFGPAAVRGRLLSLVRRQYRYGRRS